jgi:hypothetical protein
MPDDSSAARSLAPDGSCDAGYITSTMQQPRWAMPGRTGSARAQRRTAATRQLPPPRSTWPHPYTRAGRPRSDGIASDNGWLHPPFTQPLLARTDRPPSPDGARQLASSDCGYAVASPRPSYTRCMPVRRRSLGRATTLASSARSAAPHTRARLARPDRAVTIIGTATAPASSRVCTALLARTDIPGRGRRVALGLTAIGHPAICTAPHTHAQIYAGRPARSLGLIAAPASSRDLSPSYARMHAGRTSSSGLRTPISSRGAICLTHRPAHGPARPVSSLAARSGLLTTLTSSTRPQPSARARASPLDQTALVSRSRSPDNRLASASSTRSTWPLRTRCAARSDGARSRSGTAAAAPAYHAICNPHTARTGPYARSDARMGLRTAYPRRTFIPRRTQVRPPGRGGFIALARGSDSGRASFLHVSPCTRTGRTRSDGSALALALALRTATTGMASLCVLQPSYARARAAHPVRRLFIALGCWPMASSTCVCTALPTPHWARSDGIARGSGRRLHGFITAIFLAIIRTRTDMPGPDKSRSALAARDGYAPASHAIRMLSYTHGYRGRTALARARARIARTAATAGSSLRLRPPPYARAATRSDGAHRARAHVSLAQRLRSGLLTSWASSASTWPLLARTRTGHAGSDDSRSARARSSGHGYAWPITVRTAPRCARNL